MKNNLYIYCSKIFSFFVLQLFENHKVQLKSLDDLKKNEIANQGGIIFINNLNDYVETNLSNLKNDYIIFSNINLNKPKHLTNITFARTPLKIQQIENYLKKYNSNKKINFEDIYIKNKKIFNLKKNKSCFLTDIENNILIKLIEQKKCLKDYLKEKILNIKPNIQTHSLDSHLTRIRKKLEKIETNLKIKSKQDFLYLINSADQD